MNERPPAFLYKYRPINRQTIDLIKRSEAYFAFANQFTDPFDCSVVPNPIFADKDIEAYLSDLQSLGNYDMLVSSVREKGANEVFFGKWESSVESLKERTRVFSLSEKNDNPIMFSNYADGHKGVCLEFKYEDIPFFANLDKVNYPAPEDYPAIHFFQKDGTEPNRIHELIKVHYYTKHEDWKYEREWRILIQERHDGDHVFEYQKFPEHVLSSIIFGCYTSPSDRQLIKDLIKDRGHQPKLMKAERSRRSFRLNILPLDE